MFSTLRTRFGIPGVISVIALVFAMLGGAYAASSNDSGKATASKAKVVKGPRGPKGATGPAGPQGPSGADGKDGASGSNGKDGASGTDGASVTSTEFSGAHAGCSESRGGSEFVSASDVTYACNGKAGKNGTSVAIEEFSGEKGSCKEGGSELTAGANVSYACNGSPWVAGGTLPKGKTEAGTWTSRLGPEIFSGVHLANYSTSFALPLSSPLATSSVQVNPAGFPFGPKEGETESEKTQREAKESHCPGNVSRPAAASGFLCIYTEIKEYENPINIESKRYVSGVVIREFAHGNVENIAYGSWAVTAPTA